MQMDETSATVPTVDDLYRRGLYRDLGLCGQAITKLSEQMRDGDESVRDNAAQALATRIGELIQIAQCIDEPRRPHWARIEPMHAAAAGAMGVHMSGLVAEVVSFAAHMQHGDTGHALRVLSELDRMSRFCREYMRELRQREEVSRER